MESQSGLMELWVVKCTMLLSYVLDVMCLWQGKCVVLLGMPHAKAVQSAQNISLALLQPKLIFQDLIYLLLQEPITNTEKRLRRF